MTTERLAEPAGPADWGYTSLQGRARWYAIQDTFEPAEANGHVLACGEEGGGSEALIPVLSELQRQGIGATALVGGIGLQRFQTIGVRHGLHLTPLAGEPATQEAQALLLSPSYDGSLEEYMLRRYTGVPPVLIEDYYESSRYVIARALAGGLDVPTVCCIDDEAVRLIGRRFSDVTAETPITGSPAFDVLVDEPVAEVAGHVKSGLGLATDDRLAVFLMPNLHHKQLAAMVAASCRGLDEHIVLTARAHPSDSLDSQAFTPVFDGIRYVDSTAYTPDEVALAADVVIVQRSTHGLRAVLRQKPSISLREFVPPEFSLPLVDAGASLEVPASQTGPAIAELLRGESRRCHDLQMAMTPYKADGQAARRVAEVLCQQMLKPDGDRP